MHFEDIWNEAEKLSADQDKTVEDIVKTLHSRIELLKNLVALPKDQALNIGEILYELANIANITERRNDIGVNVAAGMKLAIENRRQEILEPES